MSKLVVLLSLSLVITTTKGAIIAHKEVEGDHGRIHYKLHLELMKQYPGDADWLQNGHPQVEHNLEYQTNDQPAIYHNVEHGYIPTFVDHQGHHHADRYVDVDYYGDQHPVIHSSTELHEHASGKQGVDYSTGYGQGQYPLRHALQMDHQIPYDNELAYKVKHVGGEFYQHVPTVYADHAQHHADEEEADQHYYLTRQDHSADYTAQHGVGQGYYKFGKHTLQVDPQVQHYGSGLGEFHHDVAEHHLHQHTPLSEDQIHHHDSGYADQHYPTNLAFSYHGVGPKYQEFKAHMLQTQDHINGLDLRPDIGEHHDVEQHSTIAATAHHGTSQQHHDFEDVAQHILNALDAQQYTTVEMPSFTQKLGNQYGHNQAGLELEHWGHHGLHH